MKRDLYRGEIFYFVASPFDQGNSYYYCKDGALFVVNGKVIEAGPFEPLRSRYPDVPLTDYSGKLIMPGLIDAHTHFPQSGIIGMYGQQLLDWLEKYTFPAEAEFSSRRRANETARFFVQELLRNGTTACAAYSSVHPGSVDALFSVASKYNMCMLTGKVMMNRNAPDTLIDQVYTCESDCRALIEKWDGKGRNHYVITPRFAIACTPTLLSSAGRLHAEYPNTYVQTHLSESKDEIASVRALFPDSVDYLAVYERAGLLTERSIFGHCIYLKERERKRLADVGATIVHCPTSNLFLGSGLFNMQETYRYHRFIALGTDVGAGTSFSMWKTMGEAYKIQQIKGYPITAVELLYQCTLGAALALSLQDRIGSFFYGRDADFIVMDYAVTPVQQLRMERLRAARKWTLENKLSGLQILGDDRNTVATYLMGKRVYYNDNGA